MSGGLHRGAGGDERWKQEAGRQPAAAPLTPWPCQGLLGDPTRVGCLIFVRILLYVEIAGQKLLVPCRQPRSCRRQEGSLKKS